MSAAPKAYDLAVLFAALADRTRLRLLNLIGEREVCVCYFVEILGQSQPKISRHLAYLRRAGVVAARRGGQRMDDRKGGALRPGAAQVLRETLATLRQEKAMQGDLARLKRACCSPQPLVAFADAPLPVLASAR